MEEIRSSDALDREILEDARKKADKILKQSELESTELKSVWEKKARTEIGLLEERMAERVRLYAEEVGARSPLERKRKKIEHIESCLGDSVLKAFATIDPPRRSRILQGRLRRASSFFQGKPVSALSFGISRQEAEALINEAIPGIHLVSLDEKNADQGHEGILLIGDDGAIKYRATMAEVRDEILDSNREELVRALFPGLDTI
jgi:V/A-type H+/Na+-transporting ATPase subunit E